MQNLDHWLPQQNCNVLIQGVHEGRWRSLRMPNLAFSRLNLWWIGNYFRDAEEIARMNDWAMRVLIFPFDSEDHFVAWTSKNVKDKYGINWLA